MRIGVVGPASADEFADNILDTLVRMGHEATSLGASVPAKKTLAGRAFVDVVRKSPRADIALQRRIVKKADDFGAECVITVQPLDPVTVSELRKRGAKVALWFPDHVGNLGRHVMFVSDYDAIFLTQPRLVERARKLLRAPVHYLPEACNPSWHKPPSGDSSEKTIVVAGTLYPWRTKLLEGLVREGIPLTIYGAGLPRWLRSPALEPLLKDRYIVRDEKARIFRRAAGVLNTLYPSETDGHNARLFEATGCGAAVLTEARPELSEVFVPGTEVLAYQSLDDLVDVCRSLLNEEDLSFQVGDAGSARAHSDHTYDHRLREIFDILDI